MRRIPLTASAALLAMLALTACGPGSPQPTESAEPQVSATPTPTPTATTDPEPSAVSCESLLSASLAEFTSGGLTISGPGEYAEKLQAEGNAFYAFYEADGVFCVVSGGMEAYALYGWAPFDDAGWEPVRAALLSEGWEEQVTDAGYLYTSVVPDALSVCYYRPNEFGGCAATSELLDEVFAHAPA